MSGSLKMLQENLENGTKVEYRGEGNFFSIVEIVGEQHGSDYRSSAAGENSSGSNEYFPLVKFLDFDLRPEHWVFRNTSAIVCLFDCLFVCLFHCLTLDLVIYLPLHHSLTVIVDLAVNFSLSLSTDPVRLFSSVVSQGVTTLAYIPAASFLGISGISGEGALLSAVRLRQSQVQLGGVHSQDLTKKLRKSIFSMPERQELKRKVCHPFVAVKLILIVVINSFSYPPSPIILHPHSPSLSLSFPQSNPHPPPPAPPLILLSTQSHNHAHSPFSITPSPSSLSPSIPPGQCP